MKAIVHERYGPPDVLELREVDKPVVGDDEVLVRVHATSVNPVDWHTVTGTPYLVRMMAGLLEPKSELLGIDFAGTVEAVGRDVTQFQPGDEVFGARDGAFADYVCVREERGVVHKPVNVTFEQAAAVAVAAISALQGLRDEGHIQSGQKVLINGASGGVGTFAVQIAKSFGAEVTGVCSTRNLEIARAVGADHVIDYTQEDFTRSEQRYDFILDNVANHSLSDLRRALTPTGTLVPNGGGFDNRWFASGGRVISAHVLKRFVGHKLRPFLVSFNFDDLVALKELVEAGKITPVLDRTYPLSETPQAIGHVGEGHARGKVAITV